MSSSSALLDRDDLVRGLSMLIDVLRARSIRADIRLVGGAALALHYFDRRVTTDVDAGLHPPAEVAAAAAVVAREFGWGTDWLNAEAAQFIPEWGEGPGWATLHRSGDVVIQVASARALLAMKLKAGRPGRDVDDIRHLMAICGIESIDAADDLYEALYPGEVVPDRGRRIVAAVVAAGGAVVPPRPSPPRFS